MTEDDIPDPAAVGPAEGPAVPAPAPGAGPGQEGGAAVPTAGLGGRYWKLWSASAISNFGDGLDSAALPLLAALLTRDPLVFSGVAVANRLPWLLFALQAGAIADRVDRKRLMGTVNVVRFGLMAGLGLAVLGDWASIWLLYVISFALGIGETLFDNASQALMPALVHRDDLEVANGRLYGAEIVTNQFVGPPLGGLLFGVAASLPILIDAGTYAVSAVLILAIPGTYATSRRRDRASRPRMRTDIAEGLRWLFRHRLLRTLALMLGLMNGMSAAGFAIFALFALEVLGVTEFGFGVLLTAGAVGSLAASLLTGRVVERFGRGRSLVASVVIFGVTSIVIGLTSNAYVVGAMFAASGVGVVLWNIITVSLRQSIIPDDLLGRVNSAYRFFGWGALPVGSLLGGALAEWFGLRAPFIVAGVVQLVALGAFLPIVNTASIAAAREGAERSS